jgi:hypothetical protein
LSSGGRPRPTRIETTSATSQCRCTSSQGTRRYPSSRLRGPVRRP